ncbi:lycopene cyclase [Aquimarina sp. BL5]|uniref:lycopene cyclase family protein n=1 Tax=Aquimarina sp. BL5 TaxID=1714860 RepID=UPI000E523272|nr:lycopene cyclase family protein [Aquimarina sp. BL5]AXT51748.1 lycopene cyclase [Aquimarina sp. BL5]RKM90750.1 lycopene cyclase [Aquimarina sp. BL5]
MQKYDYIITGTGASGLMLVYQMLTDGFFDQKQILLIDKEIKNQNDRTWCFWEEEKGVWDAVVSKKWSHVFFGSEDFSDTKDISPYKYKLIRSKDFYNFVFTFLQEKSNVTLVQEKLIGLVDEGDIVEVETDKRKYLGDKVFNSVLLSSAYKTQQRYPLLNQHFIGWFIKTETPIFEIDTATFMDFKVDQKGNTRFMYFLPTSETEALFEYTLFSKELLSKSAYETEIKVYLESKGIKEYQITEKEKGCIPMTCYEFRKQNSKNILHIGTAGGWTKPSTGFTFRNSERKVKKLVAFLKKNNDLSRFEKRTKFWYYDLWLLDFLSKENQNGAALFSRLFRRNKTIKILKFLDEETSFLEDIKIMSTMPIAKFLKIIWKRFLK